MEENEIKITKLKECLLEPLPVAADDYTFLSQLAHWLGEVHGFVQTSKVRERLTGIATGGRGRPGR